MNALLGLVLFLYPFVLPIATLSALAYIAFDRRSSTRTLASRTAIAISALLVLFSPGVDSTDGTFLMPWWLLVFISDGIAHYYPVLYFFICLALLLLFVVGARTWRAIGKKLALRSAQQTSGQL
jgi:hypothetical protein